MTSVYDWSATAASNNSASPQGWPENMAFSGVNDTGRQMMAHIAGWRDFLGGAKIATGTDTLALTSGLSLSAYAQGMLFAFENTTQNTGAVTLNVDSVGAKSVVKYHDQALVAGDLEASGIYVVAYEATADNFQLLSPVSVAPGDLLAANNLSDIGTAATAFSNIKQAATDSATGVVELATIAETNTGTDTARVVTPDGLAGSNYGTAVVPLIVFDDGTDCATGDGAGDIWFRVPSILNGFDLVGVAACCQTAGTTGTMDIQIHNVTQAADMLTTKITIDSAETDSSTAATAAVIDTANDDVATGDQIRIDVDAVHTTAAKGLLVELQFRLP